MKFRLIASILFVIVAFVAFILGNSDGGETPTETEPGVVVPVDQPPPGNANFNL